MSKCKHERVYIAELGTMATGHQRDMDGVWVHRSVPGDYTGIVEVTCDDCGYFKRFGKRRPKWVERCLAEINADMIQF